MRGRCRQWAGSESGRRGCALGESVTAANVQVAPLDTMADCVTFLRHLVSLNVEPPLWRRSRPHMLVEGAVFAKANPEATAGTLLLDAYVRHVGVSANQIVAVPGTGDFSIDKIWAAPEHVPQQEGRQAGMVLLDEQQDLELLAQADGDKCASSLLSSCLQAPRGCGFISVVPKGWVAMAPADVPEPKQLTGSRSRCDVRWSAGSRYCEKTQELQRL